MLRAAPALAFSDVDVPTDVIVAWADGGLAIDTTVGEVDVTVELRLVHGDDDLRWTEGPVRVSCEGDPLWNTASNFETWPDEDYLAGMCSGAGAVGRRQRRLHHLRLFAMWDAADPDDWDSDGGGGANDPKERLEAGAQAIGLLSEWTAVSGPNGVR